MSKGIQFQSFDGSNLRIGIVTAMWNRSITSSLFVGCKEALLESGVAEDNIVAIDVPGSYELPFGAQYLIEEKQVDAVVTLGVLGKGETMHFEYIAEAVTQGIMHLQLETNVPVIFGVLCCLTEAQAIARSTGDNNHGIGWAKTAIAMAKIKNHGIL